VSYGIYLLNVPVVSACRSIVRSADDHALLLFVLATAANVAVATAVFRWVESPFLALRSRFAARVSSRSAREWSR
jgi:peptidoglycan/LPS O-acetylase OafA/YrhL